METSWLRKTRTVFEIANDTAVGISPQVAKLIGLIDPEDPALTLIATALMEMRDAGIDLTPEVVEHGIKLGRLRWAQANERPTAAPARPTASASVDDGIVYYVRRGPLIKIGTTADPRRRFSEPLPDAILAYEPGGRDLESCRHKQFRHIRTGREHFLPKPDLLAHIDEVLAAHGQPDPSWPTSSNLSSRAIGPEMIPPARSPELVTATEGADRTGMKRNTVRVWAHRQRMRPVGKNAQGRELFFLDDVRFLVAQYLAADASRTTHVRS